MGKRAPINLLAEHSTAMIELANRLTFVAQQKKNMTLNEYHVAPCLEVVKAVNLPVLISARG